MFIVVRKGKYDIEYARSILGDEYSITIISSEKGIKVRAISMSMNKYKLEIKRVIPHNGYLEIITKELYGRKFRKNFEVMRKLIDPLFTKQGVAR